MADTISFGIKADDQTRRGFASVERGLNRLGGVAKSAFGIAHTGAVALTAATVGLATATALLTKREAELIKEIKLVSDTTGIAVKQVAAWTEEYRRFGYEAEDVRDVLNELNVKQNDALAGTKSAIEAFAVFGLSLQDIAGLNAHETLLAIADGFQTVEDHSRAAWAADAIFGGDMAQRTIPILLQGRDALLENARAAEMLGLVYDERAVAAAERFDRAQFGLGQQIRSLGSAIATAAMPHLTNLMNAFSAIIQLGRGLFALFPQLRSGAISFAEGFDTAFSNLPPGVQRTLAVVATHFVTALNNMLRGVWDFGLEVEQGFVDMVNRIIAVMGPLGTAIFGEAKLSDTFTKPAPTVQLPGSITDFLTQVAQPTTAWVTRGAGGGGQTYTVKPGDTPGEIAAKLGIPLADVRRQSGRPDTELQIGTQIRYGGGSGARQTSAISPDMAMRLGLAPAQDPYLMGLYRGYEQSLIRAPRLRGIAPTFAAGAGPQFPFQQGITTPYGSAPADDRSTSEGNIHIPPPGQAPLMLKSGEVATQEEIAAYLRGEILSSLQPKLMTSVVRNPAIPIPGADDPWAASVRYKQEWGGFPAPAFNARGAFPSPSAHVGRRGNLASLHERNQYIDQLEGVPVVAPVTNIYVQVTDTETFVEQLNDAIQTGAADPIIDAYVQERDARG